MSSYSDKTLNGNWFEDRCPTLRGVVADYGDREYSTTSKTSFSKPGAHHSASVPRRRPRMLVVSNYGESSRPRPTVVHDTGFDLLPKVREPETQAMTTTQATFGPGAKPSELQKKRVKDGRIAPAGGPGAHVESRGMRASGATGEVLKASSDPQESTAAQRAWLYHPDPILTIDRSRQAAAAASEAAACTSLPIADRAAAATVPRPRKELLTRASVTKDTGIWMDYDDRVGKAV